MGAPCQAGALLAPSASLIDRLEVVDSDCHQGARRNGSLRYPLFYIFILYFYYRSPLPGSGENFALNN